MVEKTKHLLVGSANPIKKYIVLVSSIDIYIPYGHSNNNIF